jgi:DNA-binding NtrC family response regulator
MTPTDGTTDLKTLVAAYERGLILDALAATGGHQRRTARRLGLLPTTLHEKMKRLGLISRARDEQSPHPFSPDGFVPKAGQAEGGLVHAST